MSEWVALSERLPEREGRHYVCVVHLPPRYNGPKVVRGPMTVVRWLEFAEGRLWLNGGDPPAGMISHWIELPPLPGVPQLRKRST